MTGLNAMFTAFILLTLFVAFLVYRPQLTQHFRDLLAAFDVGRQERDLALYEQWESMQAARTTPGTELFQVRQVYQRARTGTKAIVVSLETGLEQDSWFDGMPVRAGSYFLVRPSSGWGRHNHNPNVLYVHREQVLTFLPPGTYEAVERHQRRLERPEAP